MNGAQLQAARTIELPALPEPDPPRFGDAPRTVSRFLHIALHSCINETIGAAHLRAMMKGAANALVREAKRLMLADDIDHARRKPVKTHQNAPCT